jgi:predicted ATPase
MVKDKADILVSDSASFATLGLHSRREADRFTSDIEKLRNHLAHAQELESEHLATASRLASSIHSILRAEGAQRIIATRREAAANISPTTNIP